MFFVYFGIVVYRLCHFILFDIGNIKIYIIIKEVMGLDYK